MEELSGKRDTMPRLRLLILRRDQQRPTFVTRLFYSLCLVPGNLYGRESN